jgi:hypothetical protein
MMHITQEQVEKYMAIYLETYGVPIDPRKANDELTALLCLLAAVHRHMNKHNWPDLPAL